MTNDRDDLIVLFDEDGNETSYTHLDTIEMNNKEYVVLMEYKEDEEDIDEDTDEDAYEDVDEDTDEDSDEDIDEETVEEIIILRIEHGEDGEDSFISIDDEKEMDEVFEEFKRRMEEEYDFTT